MTRRLHLPMTLAALATAVLATTALAAPAFAVDPTPEQSALLLKPSDLPASYGKPTDASFTNVQTGGVLASPCQDANGDSPVTTITDKVSMYSEIDYPSGLSWGQSIYVYKSPAQAKKAFAQMKAKAVKTCNSSGVTTKGDDGVTIPKRRTVTTAAVTDGVIVATLKSTTKGGGKPPYGDIYVRTLTTQTGNAIQSLRMTEDSLGQARLTSVAATQDAVLQSLVARYPG